MPRNRKHGNVAVEDRPTDTPTEETAVTTATEDQDSTYTFDLEPAPADYEPERKTPGRDRKPSFFDDKLRDPSVFEQGWQRVPANSAEHKAAILRELNRAKLHLNKLAEKTREPMIGLDLDDKQDDAVYFKSRVAQTRERRANQTDVLDANAEAEGLPTGTGDDDE